MKRKGLTKVASRGFMQVMQLLRRSSAASPIPSGKVYKRKPKNEKQDPRNN